MSKLTSNVWSYWLKRADIVAEYASWSGDAAPDLGFHFHRTAQITCVRSGKRAFQIGGETHAVAAGQSILIPAMVPHRSLPLRSRDVTCLNVYLPLPPLGNRPIVVTAHAPAEILRDAAPVVTRRAIEAHFFGHGRLVQRDAGLPTNPLGRVANTTESIGAIAARAGLSREGFTRKFIRDIGMAPHAYRTIHRLNEARHRLQQGDSIAGVAADLDFSDQSHLGRLFRRSFGVTPHAYRESVR
ncbi:AraC family transcriptional regulator [Bradyrhizobium prioriisuperbiae]|uniref:helix-turn-helix domain-containing protein n=1 Tax=Bradyrhizobium prioriisuperbiae TaxID=2854389 RepID=UPI0028ECA2CD|nr:AraC family transcriptional regulator [Bradyrhizobium prioritasuperba]